MRDDHRLSRRQAMGVLGSQGTGAALGVTRLGGAAGTAEAAAVCVLSPEVTEGPHWIDNRLTRRDITEDRPGLPLELVLTVQDARSCEPIEGADVEIWHCDAAGVYSGFESASQGGGGAPGAQPSPTDAERYLRGHQRAGAEGRVRFHTIYPGWYSGRTPHIHLKVHAGGDVVHTGQLFFPESVTAAVYRRARIAPTAGPTRATPPTGSTRRRAGRGRCCGSRGDATDARATAGRSRSGWRPSRTRRGAGRRRSACGRDRA